MSGAGDPRRTKELAAIHVAAKRLALAEDSYRALVNRFSAGRTASAGAMTAPERRALIEHFRGLGFDRADGARQARRADPRPQAQKLRALWLSLWQLGEVRDPGEAALAAFLKRHTGLEAVQFADSLALNAAIEHLKNWARRAGWDGAPFHAEIRTPQEGSFRPGLIEAQWQRLAALGALRFGAQAGLGTWLAGRGYRAAAPQFLDDAAADRAIAELGRWIRSAPANRPDGTP